ncbi:MAG TPA: polyamine ABC transporter substrate-binding protein [Arenimonas sp.]|nr:polyamine ABC transporter substrate-binding protein [Arenimonas sp.]
MTLRLSLIASALLLSACSGSPEPAQTGAAPAEPAAPATGNSGDQVVYVFNWSDYVAEDTLANFEASTGIRVVYDTYDGNEILEAKLLAGASGYDVVFPSARPFAQRHIQAGVYAPMDKAALKNYGNLDPTMLAGLQDVDPGNAHTVPYMWGTTGLGINVAKVREALGPDVPLDSWALLFDPANAAKLAACGISVLDDEQETFGAALLFRGRDPNALTGDETQVVTDAYAAVRPHIRYFHSSKYIDDLANGDLCLVMGYSGDVFQAGDRAEEAENGVEIQYIIPREGALRWFDLVAIPADAPHKANAHAFIDYLLKPEVAAGISNYVAYATPNTAALPLLDPEIAGDAAIYPPAEVQAKLVDPKTFAPEVTRERVRAWTTIKTGR